MNETINGTINETINEAINMNEYRDIWIYGYMDIGLHMGLIT